MRSDLLNMQQAAETAAVPADVRPANASEAAHRWTAVSSAQAIIRFTPEGVVIDANQNFLNVMGYRLEEVAGVHHRQFCDPEYAQSPEYRRFWQSLARGENQSGEFRRLAQGGREVWLQASYAPVHNDDGAVVEVVKLALDITAERQRAADSASKLRAIERSQAVIEFNLDGTIRHANENFLATVGYQLSEIQGRHHRMFCTESYTTSPAYREFWEKLNRGEFHAGRFERVARGGRTIWLQATYNPLLDERGHVAGVAKFAIDISRQVEIEDTVRRVAGELAGQTTDIVQRSTTVARGALALGATTEEMNASVEELTASISSIASNVKSADTLARTTREEADAGSGLVRRSVEAMELIQRSSEDINEIVKVIGEIASQTNLLAFNAAIEAARAGEHGLGFSVVADEVRKLAERSAQAAREISKLIRESVKRIDAGAASSAQAGQAFEKIVGGVTRTTQVISEISLAAEEQLAAAREVSAAIQQVADETEHAAAASEGIANSTRDLNSAAQTLNDLVTVRA